MVTTYCMVSWNSPSPRLPSPKGEVLNGKIFGRRHGLAGVRRSSLRRLPTLSVTGEVQEKIVLIFPTLRAEKKGMRFDGDVMRSFI